MVHVCHSVIDWIKHGIVKVVPQPEINSKTDGNHKTEAAAPAKGFLSSDVQSFILK